MLKLNNTRIFMHVHVHVHVHVRYVGRTAQRLSSRIRQHVPLHLLPEDLSARADRATRGRPRKIPETQDLVPEATNSVQVTRSEANYVDGFRSPRNGSLSRGLWKKSQDV